MKIVDNIVPREWANTAFIVASGLAGLFWASLVIVVGARTEMLPREWLRAAPDAHVAAAATLLVLVGAVTCTAVAVKVWRETGGAQ